MKIKLISSNFDKHRELIFENFNELSSLNIDLFNYGDFNFPSRIKSLHPRLKGKVPKILGWMYDNKTEYDYYIWCDSKFTIKEGCVSELIRQIKDFDLCLFRHPHRNTISEEYEFVKQKMEAKDGYLLERYEGENMEQQIKDYMSDNEFVDNCLFACGLFVYSKRLIENKEYNILKEWFFHNCFYSVQDQLSLPYLLQKFKTNYTTFDFGIFDNTLTVYN